MFTFGLLANDEISLSPLPPAPIPAIFSLSLGAINPGPPNTCLGTIINPAVANPAPLINFLRESLLNVVFFLDIIFESFHFLNKAVQFNLNFCNWHRDVSIYFLSILLFY